MSTLRPDLDFDLPTEIPDLPPPWPPTDVAIEWWMNRTRSTCSDAARQAHFGEPRSEHFEQPFVLFDGEAQPTPRVAEDER